MIRKKRFSTGLPVGLTTVACIVLTAASTEATLILHEGFDYSAGDINGSQAGGTGFSAGGWATSGSDNLFDVLGTGLSLGSLPVTGASVKRPSAPGNAEMSRSITAASQGALLADNATLWFSVLLRTTSFSTGNANGTLVLGTDPFDGPGNKPATMTGGNAFGVTLNSITTLQAITINGGVTTTSGSFATTVDTTYLIAGKIHWASSGNNDTLRLFNITDPGGAEPANGVAFATMTADFNQSAFDTVAIADRQVATYDEIRFGHAFADVMGVIPEPSTFALTFIGLLGLLAWRSRG